MWGRMMKARRVRGGRFVNWVLVTNETAQRGMTMVNGKVTSMGGGGGWRTVLYSTVEKETGDGGRVLPFTFTTGTSSNSQQACLTRGEGPKKNR